MKKSILLIISASALILACTGDTPYSPYEATDEEAIYNVVLGDNLRAADLVIVPTEAPDTLAFIANPDSANPVYWHVVDSTEEDFQITFAGQVQSPVGMVEQANVVFTRNWFGSFKQLGYNPQADSLERRSADFQISGLRSAICQRWGTTRQRRGWLLISISDARYSAGGSQNFLSRLVFHSESNDDSLFHHGLVTIDDMLRFDAGEEVTFNLELGNDSDLLYMYVPVNNYSYELAQLTPTQPGVYSVDVTMPSTRFMYGQLRFLVVNLGSYPNEYRDLGYSFNYRIR